MIPVPYADAIGVKLAGRKAGFEHVEFGDLEVQIPGEPAGKLGTFLGSVVTRIVRSATS